MVIMLGLRIGEKNMETHAVSNARVKYALVKGNTAKTVEIGLQPVKKVTPLRVRRFQKELGVKGLTAIAYSQRKNPSIIIIIG
jgi:hypothetical protein